MTRLSALFVVLSALVVGSVFAISSDCNYAHQSYHWLVAGKDAEGYFVKIANPALVRKKMSYSSSLRDSLAANVLPPGLDTLYDSADYLAAEAGAVVLYVGSRSPRVAIPLDHVWHGATPLACLRSFAQAAGLEVAEPQPGFWLIGAPDVVDQAAILVFAYSPDTTLQPLQSEAAVGDLERALLSHLPIREIAGSPTAIGLGYYSVPGEPDTFLVVVTSQAFQAANSNGCRCEFHEIAYKVRVSRHGDAVNVDCLWSTPIGGEGPLVARVQEDFDGDGLQDFYFQHTTSDRLPADVILSGADGSVLADIGTVSLAIETGGAGPKLFAVDYLEAPEGHLSQTAAVHPSPYHAVVVRYSAGAKTAEVVGPGPAAQVASPGHSGYTAQGGNPREMLAQALGHREGIRVYQLGFSRPPGYRTPQIPGVEYVETFFPPVWNWLMNGPETMITTTPGDLPMHVLYRYLSPGYLRAREEEERKAAKDE
jgi:hypothetical protein